MLKHPNIITVYDLGEQDGFPLYVMEFLGAIRGPDDCKQSAVPLIYKLRIIEQVCHGRLGYAHHNDVVHRGCEAGNVIVRPDAWRKLLDFGIARQEKNDIDHSLTATGGVIGRCRIWLRRRLKERRWMGGRTSSRRVCCWTSFLRDGCRFRRRAGLVNQLLNESISLSESSDYPRALDTIISDRSKKDPAERYQTAEEMAADLYRWIESLKKDYSGQLIVQRTAFVGLGLCGGGMRWLQLLKLDNQHTQARRLLADVNQRL